MSHSQRGLNWFNALSAGASEVTGLPASLKVADGWWVNSGCVLWR